MGVTHVTTRISNLAKDGEAWEAEFLVDTGAIDSMAPRDKLIAAGIQPEGRFYDVDDGKLVECEYGFARVELLGAETVAQIVFGPRDSEPTLSLLTLECAGVSVDPTTGLLRQVHARPLK